MRSLDPVTLRTAGPITSAFLLMGKKDLRAAGQYIHRLPYARNSRREAPLIVLTAGRGTCSTKHALLRRLAIEQNLDIALVLGIYEMSEQNTPGVGKVLARHGMSILPEAHCYLRAAGNRIDLTRSLNQPPARPISYFLLEEDIDPIQITDYKATLHKQFLSQWIADQREVAGRSLSEIWSVREECIASLSG
jgi:hypothetical protein